MFQRLADDLRTIPHRTRTSSSCARSLRQRGSRTDPAKQSPLAAGYVYLGQFVDHDVTFNPRAGFSAETTLMVF
jgi:hypothetical protein